MNSERIKEIQSGTAYPESVSVQQALLQVWNECGQEAQKEIEALKDENERLRKDGESITESYQQLGAENNEQKNRINLLLSENSDLKSLCELGEKVIEHVKWVGSNRDLGEYTKKVIAEFDELKKKQI